MKNNSKQDIFIIPKIKSEYPDDRLTQNFQN